MNWFDTSGLTSLAKSALKEAQKTIDKALDIQDDSGDEQEASAKSKGNSQGNSDTPQKDSSDFFGSWGLTARDEHIKEQPMVTESPSKSSQQTTWGSFAGSFFEQSKSEDSAIVRPPKAKSLNVLPDAKYGSQDDLFSKSQLVMSDSEGLEFVNVKCHKSEERRASSRSNRLSLVSSQNSSDSVEVLSQSLKTTPDSPSVQSISHSSSIGPKNNSESVEILPDSLISPSSIECLGFDSYSSSSSNLSPESSDKPTPVGETTNKIETADSVSLVPDDDEDTMSYNSISECTAPTVLDTDENSVCQYPKPIRVEPQRKGLEKEFMHLEQPLIPQKMQISENSSNDGSWSDRTLNADNDSVIMDVTDKKEVDQEDAFMEKLSNSSSFYNLNVPSTEMLRSESSAFVNVEKQQCTPPDSSGSSQKDGSIKERVSPISSDSKSDLVKIGSDRTSGHTSGDELETATSSDIEIIPSPNGDSHSFCRSSPAKYAFKQSKFDGTTSPNLVDLVLGKSLATKIRGHNRELSEVSVQSNTSDESQGCENERLMRRLCEMAEILEARENRLMEVSRNNAELVEHNADLKTQVESLLAKHEGGDINLLTEDYTQRMSALEKKFQQAIREKDQLRKQLDNLKLETTRKYTSEMEISMKEKDEVIAGLQEEGEKLARQQLQHSNIIKKLRAKEKDNEQVIKNLRDKISELTAELDRCKRSLAAKEEQEVTQIEAVYRLTTANKKLETELMETRSELEDTAAKLESSRQAAEAARRAAAELQRECSERERSRESERRAEADARRHAADAERARADLARARADTLQEEKRWIAREEALRREVAELRLQVSALEAGAAGGGEEGAAGLLAQLAALQGAALARDQAAALAARTLAARLAEAEAALAQAVEHERVSRGESAALAERLAAAEREHAHAQDRLRDVTDQCRHLLGSVAALEGQLRSKTEELSRVRAEAEAARAESDSRLAALERQLAAERDALLTEKKRNSILQEQACRGAGGGGESPLSAASRCGSASLWTNDEAPIPLSQTSYWGEASLELERRRAGGERAAQLQADRLRAERDSLATHLAKATAELDDLKAVQEQYDALLQMYGEKEEQLEELKLDLQDVTQLYKAQLDELIALKQQRS